MNIFPGESITVSAIEKPFSIDQDEGWVKLPDYDSQFIAIVYDTNELVKAMDDAIRLKKYKMIKINPGVYNVQLRSISGTKEEPFVYCGWSSDASLSRPIISTDGLGGGFKSPHGIQNTIVVGLHFKGSMNPQSTGRRTGISALGPIENLHIEDCKVEGYCFGIALQANESYAKNVAIRRNVICDNFEGGQYGSGLGLYGIKNCLVEENILERNGWHPDVVNTRGNHIRSQNAYIQWDCENVVSINNISTRAAMNAWNQRCGGAVIGNVCIESESLMAIGSEQENAKDAPRPPFQNMFVVDNLLINSVGINWGFRITNAKNSAIYNNVVVNSAHYGLAVVAETAMINTIFEGNKFYNCAPTRFNQVVPFDNVSVDGKPWDLYVYKDGGVMAVMLPSYDELRAQKRGNRTVTAKSLLNLHKHLFKKQ